MNVITQLAVPVVDVGANTQLEGRFNALDTGRLENETVLPGVVTVPAPVSSTLAVQVVDEPVLSEDGEQVTMVEVVRPVTVRVSPFAPQDATNPLLLWSPEYVAIQ